MGRNIGATPDAQQLSFLSQPGQGFVDGRPRPQMQKLLGRQQPPFGLGLGSRHDVLGKMAQGHGSFVRSINLNLTNYKANLTCPVYGRRAAKNNRGVKPRILRASAVPQQALGDLRL